MSNLFSELPTCIIVGAVIFIIGFIALIIWSIYSSWKKLEDVKEKLNLIEGHTYDVVLNNGTRKLNLVYSRTTYGNRSKNGSINIYFNKTTSSRGEYVDQQVMIKYANIWKITKHGSQTITNTD